MKYAYVTCLISCLLTAIATLAYAGVPNFAPWQNIDLYYGSALRAGRMLPLSAEGTAWQGLPRHDAVLLLGADNGGSARSLDLGRTWETANGGRGFGDSMCGGYTSADGLMTLKPGTSELLCPVGGDTQFYPLLYGGPPVMTSSFRGLDSNIGDYASSVLPYGLGPSQLSQMGRTPAGTPGFANGLVYRASNHLYVSPDAGASWFPMAPQCNMNATYSRIQAVATDRGRPGHVVVGAFNLDGSLLDANISGCTIVKDDAAAEFDRSRRCGLQSVASNDDVSRELVAIFQSSASPQAASIALKVVERAATGSPNTDTSALAAGPAKDAAISQWLTGDKWRYATLAHLATGAGCAMSPPNSPNAMATPPMWQCKTSETICHGRKPDDYKIQGVDSAADPTAWCPDTVQCACISNHNCQYPQLRWLEIDPRNGFTYAVAGSPGAAGWAGFGLLTSPDGGRSWMRKGNASALAANNDSVLPPTIAPNTRGSQVLTHQLESTDAVGSVMTDDNALDLTRHPEQVTWMGRMSVAWTKCANGAIYKKADDSVDTDYHGNARPRGTLVATLPLEWRTTGGERISGVFVAIEKDDCLGQRPLPRALVFRDTTNRMQDANAPAILGEPSAAGTSSVWVPRDAIPESTRKLARQLPLAPMPAYLKFGGAAVAPSDDRVLYAWSTANTWFGAASPANSHPETSFDAGTGLWRSRNRGLSWSLVTTIEAPDYFGGQGTFPHVMTTVDITVDPQNPHRVMVSGTLHDGKASGSQLALMLEPTDAVYGAGEAPTTNCSKCTVAGSCDGTSPLCNPTGGGTKTGLTWDCRHDKVMPDFCSFYGGMFAPKTWACVKAGVGQLG